MLRSRSPRVLALGLCSCLLPAQQPANPAPAPAVALPGGVQAASLDDFGGETWGTGVAYKAHFGAAAVEFVPRFGAAAPRDFPVRYELAAIGRGEALVPVGPAERSTGERRVDYVRPGLVERYDVRLDGLEQSFVLDTLPAGRGDLVVRGHLATELQVAPGAGGLQFTLPGIGSCALGGVTAIDAAGRRCGGAMTFHDGFVDYVLPADFVAEAQLPLVVDPLFGGTFTVANAAVGEQNADVAYDLANNVYLVVYEYQYSATDTDIYAQRIDGNGALVGVPIVLEGSGANDTAPQVANVRSAGRFVAVWNRAITGEGDVQARTVEAATGLRGTILAVASGTDTQGAADLGGDATPTGDHAICVWRNDTASTVEAAQLVVNPDGTLLLQDQTTLATGPRTEPHISKSGGAAGRYLVVYRTNYGLGDFDPEGLIVDRDLTSLAFGISCDSAVNFTASVDVDGDGENWVVAWQTRESVTLQHDVFARTVHFVHPGGYALGSGIVTIEATAAVDDVRPRVVWSGEATQIAYQVSTSTGVGACYVRSIDPVSCADCEGRSRLLTSLTDDYAITGASRHSAGDTVDEALFVLERRTGGPANLMAQRWSGNDGRSQVVDPGCGDRIGTTYANCARSGYAGFAVRCVDAEPNTTAILVMSRSRSLFGCGPCRLVPDPYAGYLQFTNTDGSGDAAFAVAIPGSAAAIGLDFYLQWLVVEPVTPGCYLFGSDLSTALRTTIE